MATIEIPAGCKPSVACADTETASGKPIQHGYLTVRDDGLWLCATNRYMAVAVKVEGGGGEGLVPVQVMKLLEKPAPTRPKIKRDANQWKVSYANETTATYAVEPDNEFPDLARLGMWDDIRDREAAPFGFNPRFAHLIGKALGGGQLRADVEGPLKAIRFATTSQRTGQGRALLMPVRLVD